MTQEMISSIQSEKPNIIVFDHTNSNRHLSIESSESFVISICIIHLTDKTLARAGPYLDLAFPVPIYKSSRDLYHSVSKNKRVDTQT